MKIKIIIQSKLPCSFSFKFKTFAPFGHHWLIWYPESPGPSSWLLREEPCDPLQRQDHTPGDCSTLYGCPGSCNQSHLYNMLSCHYRQQLKQRCYQVTMGQRGWCAISLETSLLIVFNHRALLTTKVKIMNTSSNTVKHLLTQEQPCIRGYPLITL